MAILVAAILCVVIAVLPHQPVYKPVLWFLGARFTVLIALALVAALKKEPSRTEEQAEHG